jgi:lysophospholipase L1-like esterase
MRSFSRPSVALARPVAALVAVALAALVVALAATPPVSVSAFGQTVDVSAVSPNLSLSGPGEADLFGEGTLETVQHFDGPIRPLIVWQRFNRNEDAAQFIQSTSQDGRRVVRTGAQEVGRALTDGWSTYFTRLILVAGLAGGLLYLLALGLSALFPHHPRERPHRHRLLFLTSAVLVSALVTAACTGLTVVSAARQLGGIKTLADLVGTVNVAPVPLQVGPVRKDVNAVVIGDSTAAAIGNTPIRKPTKDDQACQRSSDAYAVVLQATSGYRVLNLACSSATIGEGLLGPQTARGRVLPPQLGVLQSITSASVVIVSIGANDVGWADSLHYCYGLPACNDQASDQLFQSRLDTFKVQYTQLLQQLGDLTSRPTVIVNLYYNPFGTAFGCPALRDPEADAGAPPGYGFGADPGKGNQAEKITLKIDPLESQLSRLNAVLSEGADAFDDVAIQPHFDGHELCTAQPWVQGMNDPEPFHPTAAGELAIAAADQPALPQLPQT